jgi:ADP-ribosylation factor-like protein 6
MSDVVPTIGYNEDKFVKNDISYTFYDMSGQSKYRDLWS